MFLYQLSCPNPVNVKFKSSSNYKIFCRFIVRSFSCSHYTNVFLLCFGLGVVACWCDRTVFTRHARSAARPYKLQDSTPYCVRLIYQAVAAVTQISRSVYNNAAIHTVQATSADSFCSAHLLFKEKVALSHHSFSIFSLLKYKTYGWPHQYLTNFCWVSYANHSLWMLCWCMFVFFPLPELHPTLSFALIGSSCSLMSQGLNMLLWTLCVGASQMHVHML